MVNNNSSKNTNEYKFHGQCVCIYIYIHACVYIYKLQTAVEGNLKAPFFIATTKRCRRGHYSFPWIPPLTIDLYLIMLSVKQGSSKYYFLSF